MQDAIKVIKSLYRLIQTSVNVACLCLLPSLPGLGKESRLGFLFTDVLVNSSIPVNNRFVTRRFK